MKRFVVLALCLVTLALSASMLITASIEEPASYQLADGNKPGTGGG
jgi:hypothetical protein